jgi:hypothetical protein
MGDVRGIGSGEGLTDDISVNRKDESVHFIAQRVEISEQLLGPGGRDAAGFGGYSS